MPSATRNIIPILMLVASVWGLLWFVRPQYAEIKDLQAEKEEYDEAIKNANEVRALRSRLLETYSSFSPNDWKRLTIMLPDRPQGVELARDVSNIASIFNITLESFDFEEVGGQSTDPFGGGLGAGPTGIGGGESEVVDGVSPDLGFGGAGFIPTMPITSKTLQLSFSFSTDYANFLRFLFELERSLGLADVRSISLSRDGGSDTSQDTEVDDGALSLDQTYSFDLVVDTYWVE